MKQEDKELLLKDLYGRLPYGVEMHDIADDEHDEHLSTILIGIVEDMIVLQDIYDYTYTDVEDYRPYLYPLSSMTEEQKEIYCQLQQKVIYNSKGIVTEDVMNYVNWCYENHLDINDLIPNDLAIDATGLNIY